jgi:hypothetical protein
MAKIDKKDIKNLPKHPEGDTSLNDSVDGKPPSTWNPSKEGHRSQEDPKEV